MTRAKQSKLVLTDAGFWIAVADRREKAHENALKVAEWIGRFHVVAPWPVLYESARTRMVRNADASRRLRQAFSVLEVEREDDSRYREWALTRALDDAARGARTISAVDMVIRALIEDRQHAHFSYLVTNNPNDFHDVCTTRRVELVELRND